MKIFILTKSCIGVLGGAVFGLRKNHDVCHFFWNFQFSPFLGSKEVVIFYVTIDFQNLRPLLGHFSMSPQGRQKVPQMSVKTTKMREAMIIFREKKFYNKI